MPLLARPVSDEALRIKTLRECGVLEGEPDAEFDALVRHASRLAGAPIALLSLVEESRQWFKARVGLGVTETPRSVSFCTYTIRQAIPLIVTDARVDPRFADNPLVTGAPHIVFYAGWPLVTHDGHALGSLCVIDHVPRTLSDAQHEAMALLARQVVLSLELRRAAIKGLGIVSPLAELATRDLARDDEVIARERLAQLVVHDLKNPLTVIGANATFVLETTTLGMDQREALRDVLSAAGRMQAMLLDLLDIGRVSSGDGTLIAHKEHVAVDELVRSVVGRGSDDSSRTRLVVDVSVPLSSRVDPGLLSRLLTNLIDNAQRHAPTGTSIVVAGHRDSTGVLLTVSDLGEGVRDADKRRIFEPYVQLEAGKSRTTRGLGLVFCKLAAEAHGGQIYLEDNSPRGARFCVTLPD